MADLDTPSTVDDWIDNQAPAPRSAGEFAETTRPRRSRPKKPALSAVAEQLEEPPVAAEPKPSAEPPGAGLDPPDEPPRRPPPRGGKPERPRGEIWDGCPVKPLGVNGDASFYLDVHGQMRAIRKHERQSIMHLFGSQLPALCYNFAQWTKDDETGEMKRKPNRFDADTAAMHMIAACSEKGLFDPDGAVRGVGAWCDDDGQLIYHAGDWLLKGAERIGPTTHQGKIYPAYPAIPHPADSVEGAGPAPELLKLLGTWHWQRPEIDAMAAMGAVGVLALGGALDWRAAYWVTGGKMAGKSELQKLIRLLLGEKGLIQSADTTKAGITAQLGQSSLPVAVDELEPGDANSTKERDIIVLARTASSGGRWARGSSDQKGVGGSLQSTFLFSSILIPGALKPQDRSRLIILGLDAIPEGTPKLSLRPDTWRKRGAELRRLLIDRWPTWHERLDRWRTACAAEGMDPRSIDNWATTLAMADMALHAELPAPEVVEGWAHRVAREIRAATEDVGSDADGMLLHLLTQPFDVYRRGEQHTIAQWLKAAAMRPGAGKALFGGDGLGNEADHAKEANRKLARAGLRVFGTAEEPWLFIANQPIEQLKQLFRFSEWANGVWAQSAIRVKGARHSNSPRTLEGVRSRGVEIPFSSIPGLMALDGNPRVSTPERADPGMEDFA
ncbi:hypothetical protein [Cereibacter azotoformans]|uniref:hypothetical protein n=1 Tax=Cereibacter azotoformans TaxID=43057 RepID=UPI000C6EBEB8|nr:hypothetical protein [Cereibacter azotoformans]